MDTAEKTRSLNDVLSLNPLDAKGLLQTFSFVGVWVIMFVETGLLVGFFFPGDSLLFLAGIASSPIAKDIVGLTLPLPLMLVITPICAIAGAQVGHWLGARYGRRLFARPDSRLFKREYVDKAEYYFNKYGPAKAVVLARFIPIVRTFLNPVAGVLEMPARTFFIWNVVGGILWTDGILLVGWGLAKQIIKVIPPNKIDNYIIPVTLLIVVISAIPVMIEAGRGYTDRRRSRAAATAPRDQVSQASRRDEV
ncbi:DedA family protein [Planosporangium thailandense]|uniref:DedA family protein n=1 Tax=Planosporangium thailandense TaxID=765197 RepID=A0ABX0XSB3_9ACTN|nr:DedA family protein [Planosporangium thailandense]